MKPLSFDLLPVDDSTIRKIINDLKKEIDEEREKKTNETTRSPSQRPSVSNKGE